MKEKIIANFWIALEAMLANKIRSLLTALGIIFGVGAVIAMLAIGNGAQQEILEQIKLVGVNNIVIQPIIEQKEEAVEEELGKREEKKFSPGLSLADAEAIRAVLPHVERMSAEITQETFIVKSGLRRSAKVIGVEPAYFDIFNFEVVDGEAFSPYQLDYGLPVCVIGRGIQTRFFNQENPIGKYIKCGNHWLQIIGVLKERTVAKNAVSAKLGIRDYNMDVYIPFKTFLMRYENRALVTSGMLQRAAQQAMFDGEEQEESGTQATNYHQIDRLVIQMAETPYLAPSAEVIARMLQRRHYGMVDYEITIPELLLKQQQRTKDIFNIVLGAIAGISLLVGGIGIMNIMLASVLERIKEIGLRISIGAKRQDIVLQFLFEAMMISLAGGILGILLGFTFAYTVSKIADIPTVISPASVLISFGVSAAVGLIFGITPARRAASQDPIASLRYE